MIKNENLGGTDWGAEELTHQDLNDTFDATYNEMDKRAGQLGEVKMFALSISGAVTKANLQAKGWAICDGTTASTQGISSANITASTPDLQEKFIRMSDDETSGTTGGSDTHNHDISVYGKYGIDGNGTIDIIEGIGGHIIGHDNRDTWKDDAVTNNTTILPPYYELAFFIKVKI